MPMGLGCVCPVISIRVGPRTFWDCLALMLASHPFLAWFWDWGFLWIKAVLRLCSGCSNSVFIIFTGEKLYVLSA